MKTVNECRLFFKTVGCVYNRYRLVHRWVPEMVLNVQSNSLISSVFFAVVAMLVMPDMMVR